MFGSEFERNEQKMEKKERNLNFGDQSANILIVDLNHKKMIKGYIRSPGCNRRPMEWSMVKVYQKSISSQKSYFPNFQPYKPTFGIVNV